MSLRVKRRAKAIIVTRPDGTEVEYPSQSAAAKVEPLHQNHFSLLQYWQDQSPSDGWKACQGSWVTPEAAGTDAEH